MFISLGLQRAGLCALLGWLLTGGSGAVNQCISLVYCFLADVSGMHFYSINSWLVLLPPDASFFKNKLINLILNVSNGSILRTFRNLCPLRGCQFSIETIQHLINHQPLTFIQNIGRMLFPEAGLEQHLCKNSIG